MPILSMETIGVVISFIPDLIKVVFSIVLAGTFFCWHYKKERRLFKNLSRPFEIYSISTNKRAMELELNIIKKNNFFYNCPDRVLLDPRNSTISGDLSLIILAIDENTKESDFNDVMTKLCAVPRPLIVYTLGDRRIDWLYGNKTIKDYPLHTIATTPLRLVSDIFTILSTYKND